MGNLSPKESESDLQKGIVELLSRLAVANRFMFFSIPNEGLGRGRDRKANAIRMNRLKGMGLTPGAADLVIVKSGRAYFIEVKTANGVWQPTQIEFAKWARDCGAPYAVIRSLDETLTALKRWRLIA